MDLDAMTGDSDLGITAEKGFKALREGIDKDWDEVSRTKK
jgi:hypothetical protein